MKLGLDADELASCVACGLCLPHCPTYRVTGEEYRSPRGRIAAMRVVDSGEAEADDVFVRYMDECVQCRGCETACPSGVPFGRLMEGTREALATGRAGYTPWWKAVALRALSRHRLLLAGSTALGLLQRMRVLPPGLSGRLGLPASIPIRRPSLEATGSDVWLFTGCVMDAWMRDVHVAAMRVITSTGAGVALPDRGGACCGALHVHAGLTGQAKARATAVMGSMPGEAPILVDSAGCGAAMKDYGHLLGTPEAAAFSARVLDIHEWLAGRLDDLPERDSGRPRIAVQDPCHLRHVQRAHASVRAVLSRVADLAELDDEGLCCGAGGAYAVEQPQLAAAIRDRKVAAIRRTSAEVVVSANPGCALHLAGAGVSVMHPVQVLAAALAGGDDEPALAGGDDEQGRSGSVGRV